MVIGYSSAVEIGDSFMCHGKKCFGQLKINYFNIKKMFYSGALLVKAKEGIMMVILILHVISLITLTGRDSGSTFSPRGWEYHCVKHYYQMLHCCILQELFMCSLFQVVGWPWPAASHPHSHSLTPPHSVPMGWGEKIGRTRARKLVCWDKDSLIGARKGKKNPSEAKEIAHHIWQADLCPVSLQTMTALKPKPPSTSVFNADHIVI